MPDPKESSQALAPDFQSFLFEGAVLGISRAQASHLIPKTVWWDSLNFRFARGQIKQIESLCPYLTLPGGDTGDVQTLVAINVNAANATLIALTPKYLYTINTKAATAATVNSSAYSLGATWTRWAGFADASNYYFTNQVTQVQKYIPGTGVSNLITSGPAYRGLFIENYNSHLVVANVSDGSNSYPNRIAWSDIRNFANFNPTTTNEADFFDLEEQAGQALNGASITGMGKMGSYLFIYTATSIWQMQYVGLPNVMLTTARLRDVGCYYPYALACIQDTHYFIGDGGFYKFDGNTATSIGEAVWDYFVNDLHPHYLLQNRTHAIVNRTRHEVTWFYCSKQSGGTVDKGLVYNYVENLFYPIEGRGVMSLQSSTIQQYTTMDQLTGTQFNSLTGSITSLSANSPFNLILYGVSGGMIRREQDPLDPDFSNVLPETPPYLESGSVHYGTLGTMKELTSLRLDASYRVGTGVEAQLWGRFYISENNSSPSAKWDPSINYGVGSEVVYNDLYWRRAVYPSRKVLALIVVDGGSGYDFNGPVQSLDGTVDISKSGGPVLIAFTDRTDGVITSATLSYDTYWFVGPTLFKLYPPVDYDHPGSGAVFQAILEDINPPGVNPGEWVQFQVPTNPKSVVGTWTPDFKKSGKAGWINIHARTTPNNINRVHTWRFTFKGPTNLNAPQPQQAIFNSFEEKVYLSPSEL